MLGVRGFYVVIAAARVAQQRRLLGQRQASAERGSK